jgi:hypothetical protein
MRARTAPTASTTPSAMSTSRARSQRLRISASATTASARASAPSSAPRHTPGAQPRTVATAFPISSSTSGADRAATAASAATIEVSRTRPASIVRRLRRPGSAGTSSVKLELRSDVPAGSRSEPTAVRAAPLPRPCCQPARVDRTPSPTTPLRADPAPLEVWITPQRRYPQARAGLSRVFPRALAPYERTR